MANWLLRSNFYHPKFQLTNVPWIILEANINTNSVTKKIEKKIDLSGVLEKRRECKPGAEGGVGGRSGRESDGRNGDEEDLAVDIRDRDSEPQRQDMVETYELNREWQGEKEIWLQFHAQISKGFCEGLVELFFVVTWAASLR